VAVIADRCLGFAGFCHVLLNGLRSTKPITPNVQLSPSLPNMKYLFPAEQIVVLGGETGVICNIITLVRCRLHSLSLGFVYKKG
jgi:hypothetical protein